MKTNILVRPLLNSCYKKLALNYRIIVINFLQETANVDRMPDTNFKNEETSFCVFVDYFNKNDPRTSILS